VTHVDFDIEGSKMMNDQASIDRRSQAIKGLEDAAAMAGRELHVYLTLPARPDPQDPQSFRLADDGLKVLDSALKAGVRLDGVNLMTMDYSDGRVYDGKPGDAPTMGDAAISAAHGLFDQLKTELSQNGVQETDAQVWQMVGITPQIGINATNNDGGQEVFTLADAQSVETFAANQQIGRLGFWAIGRDRNPDNNLVNLTETDSGVTQQPFDFAHIFNQFGGAVPAPGALTGVAASAGNAPGQVVLTWNTVPGAASYNVYRGTVSGGEGAQAYAGPVAGLSFTDGNAQPGTTYFYTVTAVNAAGESAPSAEVSATPQAIAAVQVDATALGVAQVTVDGAALDATAPFSVNLLPGQHALNAGGPDLLFTVAADGTLDYDAALDGVLAGRGQHTLTVLAAQPPVQQPPAVQLPVVQPVVVQPPAVQPPAMQAMDTQPAAQLPVQPQPEMPLAPPHGRKARHHRPPHGRGSRHHRPR
jgi:hypothetical protein